MLMERLVMVMVMLMERLELKAKKFSSFPSASDQDIDSMWEAVQAIDPFIEKDESLTSDQDTDSMWEAVQAIDPFIEKDESLTKKNLSSKQELSAFMTHCCQSHHYTFQIRKYGSKSCALCRPIRLPR